VATSVPDSLSPSNRRPAGSPQAAAAIWRWRDGADAEGSRSGRRKSLRREGLIRALIGAAVGGALAYFGAPVLARVAWIGAVLVLVAALASPDGVYAAIGKGLARLGQGIGKALGLLLLSPLFFLFFLPFGLLLRSGRRDRLERGFDRSKPTYWHRRSDVPRSKSSFEKAF
jgi:hypothetical protein